VALAEPHQRLVRPRVLVIDRDFDDPRRRGWLGAPRLAFEPLQFGIMSSGLITSGLNLIWNEALAGQISVTPLMLRRARHSSSTGLEEGVERHFLVDFDEDVLVASECVSCSHVLLLLA
jgi:hypothetical protein